MSSENPDRFKSNLLGTHDGFDGIWKGKTVCNGGTANEKIFDAKIAVKAGRFTDVRGLLGRPGSISGSLYSYGNRPDHANVVVTGYTDPDTNTSYGHEWLVDLRGNFEDKKLFLKGNHGPFLDCRVNLEYAGKASK